MTALKAPAASGDTGWVDLPLDRVANVAAAVLLLIFSSGCVPRDTATPPIPGGVNLESGTLPALHETLSLMITSAPPLANWEGGLAGVLGGARVRFLKSGHHELICALPQMTDTQIPLNYAITLTPPEPVVELQLCTRPGMVSNVVVRVRLNGRGGQEVQIDWSAVVLLVPSPMNTAVGDIVAFRRETACAQSSADPVIALANQLWPENGGPRTFAVNIQDHIRGMQQRTQPRSMDAVSILESGGNWVCTANANLATALIRAKGIPARTLAVIPSNDHRLEMHRIVEYFDQDEWVPFDPSSIHRDVPMKYWQSVVMATTTPEDEDVAMQPRMGSARGAPYGQELEFVRGSMTFAGPDFFWTLARPLAGFEVNAETIRLARRSWSRFLETGRLSAGQCQAASTTNAASLNEVLSAVP